jgi:hypothetical protein
MQMGFEQIAKMAIKAITQKVTVNQQRKATKASATQARVQRQDILVNKQSNNDPIYVQYGKHRMGGTRVYVESSDGAGSNGGNTKLNMVVVLTEGWIRRPTQVYFNDTVVWDINNGGTISLDANRGARLGGFISKYASTIIMTWYNGIDVYNVPGIPQYPVGSNSGSDMRLQTSTSNWYSDAKLQGVCYFALLLEAESETYGGQLPTVTVDQEGKRMLAMNKISDGDTESDVTEQYYTFSGAPDSYQYPGNFDNPANVLYDFLISTIYGKGLDRDENGNWVAGRHIDIASFQQARLDCNAARSGAGYGIDGYLQTEKQLFDNVGEILETCNGLLLFLDGKYHLRIQKKDEHIGLSSSQIFDKDTIIGPIALSMPTKKTKLNKITGTFSNPANKYNDDVIIIDNPTYRVEDNGSVLEATADYTLITDSTLVTDLITQTVNKSRTQQTLTFTAAHTALLLRSGDIIEVRHPEFGWGTGAGETQKFWRVQELTLTEENTVEITALTYDSTLEL